MNSLKFEAYLALYKHPLTEYIKSDRCVVLLIGNVTNCSDMFKAVFWCGQLPNIDLEIRVNSLDNNLFLSSLRRNLPGLVEYLSIDSDKSEHKYATLSMVANINASDIEEANYILVADDEYGLKYKSLSSNKAFLVTSKDNSNEISDLIRIAKNINFFYNHSTDLYVDKKKCDERFEQEMSLEMKTIVNNNNLMAFDRYLGAPYSYDSSLSFAVSIPYKCSIANDFKETINPLSVLLEAIEKKNDKYHEIIQWEHRRWNAFMLTRGFTKPTLSEESVLLENCELFSNKLLKHMCVCESDTKSRLFYDSDYWYQDISSINDKLPPLDFVSLKYHQALNKKVNDNKSQIADLINHFKTISTSCNDKKWYIANCIEKLLSDSPNAHLLFSSFLNESINKCEIPDNDILFLNENLDLLQVLCKRNQRINLADYDEKLVRCIPMSVWYEKSAETVVVFSTGNPLFDATIPAAMLAKNNVFIVDMNVSKRYRNVMIDFLSSRHCENVHFYKHQIGSSTDILECYNYVIESFKNCIFAVDKNYKHIIFELNNISSNLDIITLDSKGHIEKLNEASSINCCGLSPNFTIKHLLKLTNNYQKNEHEIFLPLPNAERFREYHLKLCSRQQKMWAEICCLFNGCNGSLSLNKEKALLYDIDNFIKILEDSKIIKTKEKDNRFYYINYNFQIINNNLYKLLFSQNGKLFELIAMYMWKKAIPSSNVETSVEIMWNSEFSPYNEIDVVVLFNNVPFLISCKDTKNLKNEMIYEISSLSSLINGIPILMCSHDLTRDNSHFIQVAKNHKVSLIDYSLYSNQQLFENTVEKIVNGELVFPISKK